MSGNGPLRVATDRVVTIEYRASLSNGDLIDSTDHCGPVTYLHGNEQIFPRARAGGRWSRGGRGATPVAFRA
jgi:hypothetical protein